MNSTDLQNILTIIAILIALVFGIGSWIQVSISQKKEKKQRLLNEIIDWTLRLSSCWNENSRRNLIISKPEQKIVAKNLRLSNLAHSYVVFQRQQEYFRIIASKFSGVLPALNEVLEKVQLLIEALAQQTGDVNNDARNGQTADANIALYGSIKALMEILTEIKIKT
jgi:hypothetical protein